MRLHLFCACLAFLAIFGPACGDESSTPDCDDVIDPGPAPLRRLTRVEYNNTIFQLLGDPSRPADAFPADEQAMGFFNQAEAQSVSPLLAERYMDAATDLAERHVDKFLAELGGCRAGDAAACQGDVRRFVTTFGKRVFRRPLTDPEVDAHVALFDRGVTLGEGAYDARTGLRLVLQAMLQSPYFLYRVEFGRPEPVQDGVVPLSPYELATRLSYLLWNSMPDAALFEAADRGELSTPEQIESHARRLLAAPRAREAVRNFHRQWLALDRIDAIAANGRDPTLYPDYDERLLPLLREEIEAFLDHAIFEEDADLETLFSAPYSMMNAELAAFYGVEGPRSSLFEKVELDPDKNAGFLTRGGLMAMLAKPERSSPVHRGLFVRERILCQVPPPPPDVVPEPPDVDPSRTTREQFIQHEQDPLCAGCHSLMDPIGFGFEHYDALGRYRETEWGRPIDATGYLIDTLDIDGEFDGAVELARRLAGSQQVRDCVATQWFRFAYGRAETDADECSMQKVRATFADSGYDIKELLIALTQTEAFRYRRVVAP